jgi:hypothetical protein
VVFSAAILALEAVGASVEGGMPRLTHIKRERLRVCGSGSMRSIKLHGEHLR